MKTRKRILATLLSVAVAATTILSGASLADAATIVTVTDENGIETKDTWTESMEKKNVGGEFYWRLKSGDNNDNVNDDYSRSGAPAVILDYSQDLTFTEGEDPVTVGVDIYPNGTVEKLRFGIMVKYVDPTHWAWINYDVGSWIFQYQCDSLTNKWPTIPEFANNKLSDNENVSIKVTYTAANQLDLTLQRSGGDKIEAVINDEDYDNVLTLLEEYAATAGVDEEGNPTQTPAPIRYGFKAGTYSGTYTDINLRNLTKNDEDIMSDNWDWVVDREGQIFDKADVVGGTNYVALNGKTSTYSALESFSNGDVSGIFRPVTDNPKFALASGSIAVGYDGGWYYQVGNTKTPAGANPAVSKDTDYAIAMTVENGKLTATAAPATEGAAPVTIANDVTVSASAAGAIALKAEAGTEVWVRDVNYEKREYAEATELQNKYNDLKTEADSNNAGNKYFTDAWNAFKTAADNAGNLLAEDTITPSEAETALSRLNSTYATLQNSIVQESAAFKNLKTILDQVKDLTQTTTEGTYSNALWSAFVEKRNAAQKIVDEITTTPYQNESALTRTRAYAELDAAFKALAFLANDQDKAGLQAAVAEANALNASHYEEAGWNTFAAARDEAAAVLANADATKDQITDALTNLNFAKEGLVAKAATSEDITASNSAVEAIKNAVNGKLTADAAYTNALQAVEALLKKENVTKKELDDAIAVLDKAKGALKPIEQTPAPVPAEKLKKGQTKTVGKMTYKVLDPAKKTVALTKGQDKKSVTIPATVKIDGETCKVVTVAKGAFKGSKKLVSVTVGKNVTKIEANAFNNCKKLNKVTFKGADVKTVAKKAFAKTASKMTVKVPKKLRNNKFKKKLTDAGMKKVTLK